MCVGSLYWTCVTFGAVTIMQLVGEQQGLALIEMADPLLLLVSLPTVPVFLVLGKMVRWEEPVSAKINSHFELGLWLVWFMMGSCETSC